MFAFLRTAPHHPLSLPVRIVRKWKAHPPPVLLVSFSMLNEGSRTSRNGLAYTISSTCTYVCLHLAQLNIIIILERKGGNASSHKSSLARIELSALKFNVWGVQVDMSMCKHFPRALKVNVARIRVNNVSLQS